MKQVFRLVDPGRVDKMIGFEELPERLLKGIRRGSIDGFPRHWKDEMGVDKNDRDPRPFYVLEYKTINSDKERWQEIGNYVRMATDKKVRLLDHLEDMAISMANDSYSQMTIEPEDITLIPIPKETDKKEPFKTAVEAQKEHIEEKSEQPVQSVELKKRGRPKKALATV